MNTIVLNTLTGAVSEYDWQFQSLTPTHAGDVMGLYALGGDTDAEQSIEAEFTTPRLQWGTSLKKALAAVYFSMSGSGPGTLRVHCTGAAWDYPVVPRSDGVTRAVPGKGIRENYLAFSFLNIGGAAFQIDKIEAVEAPSKTRRI